MIHGTAYFGGNCWVSRDLSSIEMHDQSCSRGSGSLKL
jgi:hypothetical protein